MDSYRTVAKPSEPVVYKDRKSKFFGFVFPISHASEVKPILDALRRQYEKANHVCYAWQLGTGDVQYRVNDDGEPNNSAGKPIYGQIQAFEVTNVLVVVVRYFGGTKLGVGGLIGAYKNTAQLALEHAGIIEKKIEYFFELQFEYATLSAVMRMIKKWDMTIHGQSMDIRCTMKLSLRKSKHREALRELEGIYGLKIKTT